MDADNSDSMDIDVSIHIANPESEHRMRSPQATKRPIDENKNRTSVRKRARSQNPSEVVQVETRAASEGTEQANRATSFRHLFSFAEKDAHAEDKAMASDAEPQPFALFGEQQPTSRTGNFTLFDEENKHSSRDLTESRRKASATSPMTSSIGGNEAYNYGSEHGDGGGNPDIPTKPQSSPSQRERAHAHDVSRKGSTVPPHRLASAPQNFVKRSIVHEHIDTSPEAVLALAKQFCRTKTVAQLEKEWCEENGIRDQMKKAFKLKRNRSLKDRNLSGASKI